MSTNERRREARDEAWRHFCQEVDAAGATPVMVERVKKAAVDLARAHAGVVVLDGEWDRYHPFPPEDE